MNKTPPEHWGAPVCAHGRTFDLHCTDCVAEFRLKLPSPSLPVTNLPIEDENVTALIEEIEREVYAWELEYPPSNWSRLMARAAKALREARLTEDGKKEEA